MADDQEILDTLQDDELLNDDPATASVGGEDDAELAKLKERMEEMEQEAEKLKMLQEKQNMKLTMGVGAAVTSADSTEEERLESDSRSIYIGSCDYSATPEEVESHFKGCGKVNRVMIKTNKFTGQSMGYAYLEFADKDSVKLALALDGSLFRGRQLVVKQKRHNIAGLSRGRGGRGGRRGRGRGFRGRRGRGRRGRGFAPSYGYAPY